jgi:hypothetical protein
LFLRRSSTFVPVVEVEVLILILIQEYWIISGGFDQTALILLSLVSDRGSDLGGHAVEVELDSSWSWSRNLGLSQEDLVRMHRLFCH